MNMTTIGGAGGAAPAGASGGAGFDALLADAAKDAAPLARSAAGPASGPAVRMDIGRGSAMPADEEFVLIDDVSVEETATGSEVVVKGEAVSEGQAKVAAAEGGTVILPLSSPRLQSRSIAGSMFASMLLDQRSGALPNPFSLMRLPTPAPAPPAAQSGAVGGAGGIPPVSAISQGQPAYGSEQQLADAPATEDALATGKELSRLEAAISQLIEKLEDMVRSLTALVATLGRGNR